jgi:hypothetical protein
MCARLPPGPVDADACLRALSRTTATVWVAAALLALVAACDALLGAAGALGGSVGVVAATTALVGLLLVACLLLSIAAWTVAAVAFWLRGALREAWNARTPPHSAPDDDGPDRGGTLAADGERATSRDRAVAYLYRCLAASLVAFVGWLAVGAFSPALFGVVADSVVVEVAITVATFFVGVPLSAFPDVVVATGTGQPVGPDVVALVVAVVVLPSVPGVLATANGVHYLAGIHYDAFHWAYAAASGRRYRGVRDCAWTDHVAVHAVTVACVAGVASTALPYLAA